MVKYIKSDAISDEYEKRVWLENFDGSPESVYKVCEILNTTPNHLTEAWVSEEVTSIKQFAFRNCYRMVSVHLSYGLKEILWQAFRNCVSLTSVTIPDTVTRIEAQVFDGCNSLVDVILPNHIEYISDYLFSDCTSLKSVKIPQSVIDIYPGTFYGCSSLNSMIIPSSVDWLYGKWENYGIFENCISLTNIKLPHKIRQIPPRLFKGCTNLKECKLPKKIKSLGSDSFNGCESLTDLYLPDSIKDIGSDVFYNCPNLTIHTSNPYVIDFIRGLKYRVNLQVDRDGIDWGKVSYGKKYDFDFESDI